MRFLGDTEATPNWRGTHRLVVAPPLVALDLCWTPGEPLRIMTFSRGDWEEELLAMAARHLIKLPYSVEYIYRYTLNRILTLIPLGV